MLLTLEQLLDFAKNHPDTMFDINNSENWLAAKCATQLSGVKHKMETLSSFSNYPAKPVYTQVPYEYVELCERLIDNNYHIFNFPFSGKRLADEIQILIEKQKQDGWEELFAIIAYTNKESKEELKSKITGYI